MRISLPLSAFALCCLSVPALAQAAQTGTPAPASPPVVSAPAAPPTAATPTTPPVSTTPAAPPAAPTINPAQPPAATTQNPPAPSPSQPVVTMTPQAEIAGAKSAMQKFFAATSFAQFGSSLTNHSAGYMALKLGDLFRDTMLQATAKLPPHADTSSPELQKLVTLPAHYHAILGKYGITDRGPDLQPALDQHGRALFADVMQLMLGLPDSKSALALPHSKETDAGMSYHVVSPTNVRVTDNSDGSTVVNVLYEDGAWRIDMSDAMLHAITSG